MSRTGYCLGMLLAGTVALSGCLTVGQAETRRGELPRLAPNAGNAGPAAPPATDTPLPAPSATPTLVVFQPVSGPVFFPSTPAPSLAGQLFNAAGPPLGATPVLINPAPGSPAFSQIPIGELVQVPTATPAPAPVQIPAGQPLVIVPGPATNFPPSTGQPPAIVVPPAVGQPPVFVQPSGATPVSPTPGGPNDVLGPTDGATVDSGGINPADIVVLVATSTPLPTYTPFPSSTPSTTPTATPVPTQTPFPTDTPYPTFTPTPIPTYTPLPTYTVPPTNTAPAVTSTSIPTATPTPVPAGSTSTPTSTRIPTVTPTGTSTPIRPPGQ